MALVGRSGSGKSSLLNLLCGIDRPDSGLIEIGGVDLATLSERDLTLYRRRNVGFVYQAFNLVPTLSVAANVALVLELNRRRGEEARRRLQAILEAVGLAARHDSYPDVLSGGEQQRVAIARAIVHEPVLLLADEPTGNLDERTAARILELLLSVVRDAGSTLVVATHSRAVADTCDRILELRDGRLVPA